MKEKLETIKNIAKQKVEEIKNLQELNDLRVKVLGKKTIVTNGDQTDTIFEGLKNGLTFEQSLQSRKYEHDAPNYTPRISSVLDIEGKKLKYSLSILKSDSGNPENTLRFTFDYDNPLKGQGRFIHTYMGDGNPLPSFEIVNGNGLNNVPTNLTLDCISEN